MSVLSTSVEPGGPQRSRQGRSSRRGRILLTLGLALTAIIMVWPAHELRSDNFVIYLPNAHQVIPLESLNHAQYLPLLPLLNLVGAVSGVEEKGNSLKLFMGDKELRLHNQDRKVKVNKDSWKLSNPALLLNGRWLVPRDFVDVVLPKLTDQRLEYRPGDERLFIGDVRAASLAVERSPLPNGTRLTVQFSEAENVHAASSNGKWILTLAGHPIEPTAPALKLQDSNIREVQFDDQDGVPKLIITPAENGLNFYSATLDQGRKFQVDIVRPTVAAIPTPQATPSAAPPAGNPAAPSSAPAPAAPAAPPAAAPAPPPLPVIVLDAGHGGADSGARSRDGVAEKDVAAGIVERARSELASGNRYRVILTRAGDSDPSFDERDAAANQARPIAFVSVHAGNLGSSSPRLMVYTYQPSSLRETASTPSLFAPWESAQEPYLDQSHDLAGKIEQQLTQVTGLSTSTPDQAPVRQLRSVSAPAVAIEVGSLRPDSDAGVLGTPDFQQKVAGAIARGLETFRGGASSP